MNKEELREKIRDCLLHLVIRDDDAITADEAIGKILSIPEIKTVLDLLEQTKDKCATCAGKGTFVPIDELGQKCYKCSGTGKTGDYHPERLVVLDNDQKLPENTYGYPSCPEEDGSEIAYEDAQQNMLRAGFRKVKGVGKEVSDAK